MGETDEQGEMFGLNRVPLEKLNPTAPIRDYSELWDLPIDPRKASFVIKADKDGKPAYNGLASSTEGRTFTLDRFVFRFPGCDINTISRILPHKIPRELLHGRKILPPATFNDYQEKGGGVQDALLPDRAVKNVEAEKIATYFPRDYFRKNPGTAMGAAVDSEISLDESFSVLFHLWGGRTRLPIATYPVDRISTPDGQLTIEAAEEKGYVSKQDTLFLLVGE